MAAPHDPQDLPDDAASLVPNRRERRGGKSHASVPHGGKSAAPRGPAPLPRQYSTRRRGG